MRNLLKRFIDYDNLLVICSNKTKDKLIQLISLEKGLRNITYKTPVQVSNDLVGKYKEIARIKIASDYGVSPELASIMLRNSLLVADSVYGTLKLDNLVKIKNEYSKYLIKNPLILNQYKNNHIVIIKDGLVNDLFNNALKIIKDVNSDIKVYCNLDQVLEEVDIYEFDNYKNEINSLVNNVGNLLFSGIDKERIKIHLPRIYYNYANEVFTHAGIELNISQSYSLSSFEITKRILRDLKGLLNYKIEEAFNNILENYSFVNPVLDKIIDVFNSYIGLDLNVGDIYSDLEYSLKSKNYSNKYTGGINVVNILEDIIDKEDYVFVLGMNQDIFPITYRDDDYLLNHEKKILGIPASSDKNRDLIEYAALVFKSIKNLYLSYAISSVESELLASSFIGKFGIRVNIVQGLVDSFVSYSSKNDEINLGKHLDLFYKFDVVSDELYTLYNQYPGNIYRKYDNQFTGVSKELLNQYLKDGITLSYTAIDKFNNCGFLFYVENVLKIRRFSNDEAILIGNIIHDVLYKVLSSEKIDDLKLFMNAVISDYVTKNMIILSLKDKFYIKKYIDVLDYLLDFIHQHNENSLFKILGLEKEFSIELELDTKVTLKGKIDKVLTLEIGNVKYAVVVDYKSGNTDFDLNRIVHGLNMQIMFYFYFLNNVSDDKFEFAGGYLQGVMPNNPFGNDPKKTYIEQLYNHFKLEGYSSDDVDILKKIDSDITEESKFISGIRFTNSGDFYSTTRKKLINKDVFNELLNLTEKTIYESSRGIINGEFNINPKRIGNKVDSCSYCSYRDLCFRSNKDYKNLKEFKDFEFIGGNDDSN